MADRGDTHYSVSSLNKWFLLSSVAILLATVWMMIDDWERPWKHYQRDFREIEIAKARAVEQELTAAGAAAREAELMKKVSEAEQRVAANEAKIAEVTERQRLARGELWNAIEAAKKKKSAYNWDRYILEEKRLKEGNPTLDQDKLDTIELKMNEAMGLQQGLEAQKLALDIEISDLTRERDSAKKALSIGSRDLEQVRKRLVQLDRTAMSAP
ncbi:MAG: hypothetical protein ACKO4Q_11625, partial [Planctomycetota bacterium]